MDSDKCETDNQRSRNKLKLDDEATTSRIESLPLEVLLCILSLLHLSSLMKFKFLCRLLLIQDPYLLYHLFQNRLREDLKCLMFHSNNPIKNNLSFVDFYSTYANEETALKKIQMPFSSTTTELDLVGSCNGMLMFFYSLNNGLCMYNPYVYWGVLGSSSI